MYYTGIIRDKYQKDYLAYLSKIGLFVFLKISVLLIAKEFLWWHNEKHIQYFALHHSSMYVMAFPVVEFSREGYKIRKVFG